MSPDRKKPCLHCQLWEVLKKRLPRGRDGLHDLSHGDALEALSAVAEFAGELLAGVSAADRQEAFDVIVQTMAVAHEAARGDGPKIDGAKIIANCWII